MSLAIFIPSWLAMTDFSSSSWENELIECMGPTYTFGGYGWILAFGYHFDRFEQDVTRPLAKQKLFTDS